MPEGCWLASDWPARGQLTADGFCRGCGSWWCPHAAPHLYSGGGRKTELPDSAFERFKDARNTLVLDKDHRRGISRGLAGQAFAAGALGVSLLASENAPYDFRAADGTRVDVKTTKQGMPLMVPEKHAYKLDPLRVDAFLLVWDGGGSHQLVGQIGVQEFCARKRNDRAFPIPTMYVDARDLGPVPSEWYAG